MARRLILVFAALAPLVAIFIWQRSLVAAVGVVFVSHMLLLYPTLRATSSWLGPVVTRFTPAGPEVWLTIDDGPTASDTEQILDLLDRHEGKATFFVKGKLLRENPALGRLIIARGHSLGNHSDTHPSGRFWALGPSALAREIDECNRAIEEVTGENPRLFRAPVGMKNPFVHPLLAKRGQQLVAWSARGFDGVRRDPAAIVEAITGDLQPGAIILAHQGREEHLATLRLLLEELSRHGFRCVVPDESALLS